MIVFQQVYMTVQLIWFKPDFIFMLVLRNVNLKRHVTNILGQRR